MVKGKCDCKPGMGILGMILLAAGIYFLVWGFMAQTASVISWEVFNWGAGLLYLIGILLFGVGKMLKYQAHGSCKLHSMK